MIQRLARQFHIILVCACCVSLSACVMPQPVQPTSTPQRLTPPSPERTLARLPLTVGTRWVYSYVPYLPLPADPTQIITATYTLTETVVETEARAPYAVAHIRRDVSLVFAPPDWNERLSALPKEFWYVVSGDQVFESSQRPEADLIGTRSLVLRFHWPLFIGKSWCPVPPPSTNPACLTMGKLSVVKAGDYETPVGKFSECFEITEDFNSGGVTRWFCEGIGIVAQSYDHSGTRFGFQQTLIGYRKGSP